MNPDLLVRSSLRLNSASRERKRQAERYGDFKLRELDDNTKSVSASNGDPVRVARRHVSAERAKAQASARLVLV